MQHTRNHTQAASNLANSLHPACRQAAAQLANSLQAGCRKSWLAYNTRAARRHTQMATALTHTLPTTTAYRLCSSPRTKTSSTASLTSAAKAQEK
jgi:hypothetical protein